MLSLSCKPWITLPWLCAFCNSTLPITFSCKTIDLTCTQLCITECHLPSHRLNITKWLAQDEMKQNNNNNSSNSSVRWGGGGSDLSTSHTLYSRFLPLPKWRFFLLRDITKYWQIFSYFSLPVPTTLGLPALSFSVSRRLPVPFTTGCPSPSPPHHTPTVRLYLLRLPEQNTSHLHQHRHWAYQGLVWSVIW